MSLFFLKNALYILCNVPQAPQFKPDAIFWVSYIHAPVYQLSRSPLPVLVLCCALSCILFVQVMQHISTNMLQISFFYKMPRRRRQQKRHSESEFSVPKFKVMLVTSKARIACWGCFGGRWNGGLACTKGKRHGKTKLLRAKLCKFLAESTRN